MKRRIYSLTLVVALLMTIFGVNGGSVPQVSAAPTFAKGADISWVAGMEAQGYTWKDKKRRNKGHYSNLEAGLPNQLRTYSSIRQSFIELWQRIYE